MDCNSKCIQCFYKIKSSYILTITWNYWIDWFKRFIDVSVELGAKSIGSHLGILTAKDNSDLKLREERVSQNIECWHIIGAYAKKKNLEFISWEPMSISREQGETISQTEIINHKLNQNAPIPFKIFWI